MKTSISWNFRSECGKIMMGLALATMICSINVATSFGEDRWERHDEDRYGQRGRGYDEGRYEHRGRGYDRYEHRGGRYDRDRYVRGRRVYRSEDYGGRVYVPPPVVIEPPPLPGISIFFPPFIFH